MHEVVINTLDLWTTALLTKSNAGRGSNRKHEPHGIKKLRELIFQLATSGKLLGTDTAGWSDAFLGDIGEWGSGGTPLKSHPEYYGGDIPWLVIGDLNDGLVTKAESTITTLGLENSSAQIVPKGTLLIAMYGSIGKLAITGISCATNQAIAFCIPDKNKIETRYLLLYLRAIRDHLLSRGQGLAQQNISQKILKATAIKLPTLGEQKNIVAKVDQLIALCDQLEQRQAHAIEAHQTLIKALLATLSRAGSQPELTEAWTRTANHFDALFTTEQSIDRLEQTILQLAVMGKLVPQHSNDEPATSFYKRKVDLPNGCERSNKQVVKGLSPISLEELPRIPETWTYLTVDDLYGRNHILDYADGNHGSLYPRKEDFGNDGVLFVTATQITDRGGIAWEDCPRLAHEKAKQLTKGWSREGDVYFTHNATVGRTAIADACPEDKFLLGTSVTFYRVNPSSLYRRYLYLFLSSGTWRSQAEAVMRQTTRNQVSITKQALFFLALPPLDEQERITRTVDRLFPLLEQLRTAIKEAQKTQVRFADAVVEEAVA